DEHLEHHSSNLIPTPVYSIDTLIPYEEYTLTPTTSLNTGPLTADQGLKFRHLLEKFADIFATDINELGKTDLVSHRIFTEDVPPIRSRPYSIPQVNRHLLKRKSNK